MHKSYLSMLYCYRATVSDAYKAAYAAKKKHLAKALNRDVNSIINPSYQPIIDAMFAIRKFFNLTFKWQF